MLTALLFADDEAVRSRLQLVLERNVFEVLAVAGLKDALRRIAEEKVDCRLSQLRMSHSGVQADELFIKPIESASLGKLTCEELSHAAASSSPFQASAASILEHELDAAIQYWMELVEDDKQLTCISLSSEDRTRHFPNLLTDLVKRLPHPLTVKADISLAARGHGDLRPVANTTIRLRSSARAG
jgi:CheY-like chemotaxis protein